MTESLPSSFSESKNSYFEVAQSGSLAERVEELVRSREGETGVFPLSYGTDAYLARINLVKSAKESIDLQYYIYKDDITAKFLNHNLHLAAKRGVRIRMLLDDLSSENKNEYLNYLNSFPNVEIRLFNPSPSRYAKGLGFLFHYSKLNHRMHNKSFTVDGRVSVMGGRNIGDEYFNASLSLEFGDLDLLLIGESVELIGEQFDLFWNSSHSYALEDINPAFDGPEYEKNGKPKWDKELEEMITQREDYRRGLERSPIQKIIKGEEIVWSWGKGELYHDVPDKAENKNSAVLMDALRNELLAAKNQLLIVSPYFIPGAKGAQSLIEKAKSGVEVIVITNSLASTDVVPVYSGYAPYRKALIKGGVKLYEVKAHPEEKKKSFSSTSNSSLHAKTIVIDQEKTFVGSLNLDPRSINLNTELGVVFENAEFARRAQENLLRKLGLDAYRLRIKDGKVVWDDSSNNKTHTKAPKASWLRRASALFFGFLPIEGQL